MQQQYHLRQSWLWLMLLPLFIIMSSCSGTEDILGIDNSEISTSKMSIAFSASDDWNGIANTRGTSISSFQKGDAIGVFAYFRPSSKWGNDVQEFMVNQKVVYDGSSWSYSPMKYWPNQGDIVFYAYAPYDDDYQFNLDTSNGTRGETTIHVSNDTEKQTDMLISPVPKIVTPCNVVKLTFEHIMSRIVFSGKNIGESQIKRISVSRENIKDVGSFHLQDSKVNWTALDATQDAARSHYDFYSGEGLAENASGTQTDETISLMKDANTAAFFIPQDITGNVSVEAVYTSNNIDYTKKLNIPSPNWEASKTYNYVIDFGTTGEEIKKELPAGYTSLEYVESTDQSDPINLGILTNGGHWGVKMKLAYIEGTQEDTYPIGALDDGKLIGQTYMSRFYGVGINKGNWQCGWGEQMILFSNPPLSNRDGTTYTFTLNYQDDKKVQMGEGQSLRFQNIDLTADIYKYYDSDFPIYLFGIYKATEPSLWIGRIYSVLLTHFDHEIMDLSPCKDPNGKVGMYDLIEQKFYPLINGVGSDESTN